MNSVARRAKNGALGVIVFVGAWAAACGSNDNGSGFDDGSKDGGGADGQAAFTLRIDPPTDSETTAIGVPGKSIQFHAFRRDPGATADVDVTSQVVWSIENDAMATSSGGGAFALLGIGGVTKVDAALQSVGASADLTVKVTGSAYLGSTSPASADQFTSATPDSNP
ncbi:MAG: hypothetical protein ACRELY_07485, partial [Polyangiaceae bacterium]